MKRIWRHILAVACALPLLLPGLARAEPAYWIISDDDTEILLIGTIHLGKRGQLTLPAELVRTLPVADRLYLESRVDTRQGAPGEDGLKKYGRLPEGQTLRDVLPAALLQRLEQTLAGLGFPLSAVEGYRPWAISILLQTTQMSRKGYQHTDGVESLILDLAEQAGVEIRGLETPGTAMQLLAGLSPETDRLMLESALSELGQVGDFLDQTVTAWQAGDLATLQTTLLDEMDKSAEFSEAVLHKRTRAWVTRTVELMQVPGVFVIAVGTGHLLGERGMPALLAREGLRIRRGGAGG